MKEDFNETKPQNLDIENNKDRTSEDGSEVIGKGPFLGIRHLQTLLIFLGLTSAYGLRVNMGVAIVAMTDKTSSTFPVYEWSESVKSMILSSFFWGYVVTQVPAGQIAEKFGGKYTIFTGLLICSILNLGTPYVASVGGWQLLCAFRVVQGLCQGVLFPSTHALISKWAPLEERGQLGTYAYAGGQFGSVIMLASSGFIASSALGWPGIFYVSGGGGIIWCLVWLFVGASSPADFKSITPEELNYIQSSARKANESEELREFITPWRKIFTSVPFYALLVSHAGNNFGFWTLMTEMPAFMKGVLKQDIKSNALLSSLPYLAMLFSSFVFSYISGLLNQNRYISLTFSRKLFNTIGEWIPMVALFALAYVTEVRLAVTLLTIGVGFNGATYLGYVVNHMDLAHNFAGTLMGITNGVANIMSFIAPLTVGAIVTDNTNPSEWRIVFFITAGIYLFANLSFMIFGSAVTQEWNEPEPEINHNRSARPSRAELESARMPFE